MIKWVTSATPSLGETPHVCVLMLLHSFTLLGVGGGGEVEKLSDSTLKTESSCRLNYIFIGHIKLVIQQKPRHSHATQTQLILKQLEFQMTPSVISFLPTCTLSAAVSSTAIIKFSFLQLGIQINSTGVVRLHRNSQIPFSLCVCVSRSNSLTRVFVFQALTAPKWSGKKTVTEFAKVGDAFKCQRRPSNASVTQEFQVSGSHSAGCM